MNLTHDLCPCLKAAINAGMISLARKSGQLRTGMSSHGTRQVGSTQHIEHLEPEDVQSVVDGALAAFAALVQQPAGALWH